MSHLKYFNVMINVSTKHRLFIVPGQGISFIWIVVRIRFSWAKHKFNLYCCENKIFENRKRKTSGLLNYYCLSSFYSGRFYPPASEASRGVY